MSKIQIAITDRSEGFRKRFVRQIESERDMTVLMQATSLTDLQEMLNISRPDILIIEMQKPLLECFILIEKLKLTCPKIKIIILSECCTDKDIVTAYMQGINAWHAKNEGLVELLKIIRLVLNHGTYITEKTKLLMQKSIQSLVNVTPVKSTLVPNEKHLIKLILKGMTSRQIGEEIYKSHRTIEDIRARLYLKLGVNNKEELIKLAIKNYCHPTNF
jgi:DNA-binding NarL/FixJ family response regulator